MYIVADLGNTCLLECFSANNKMAGLHMIPGNKNAKETTKTNTTKTKQTILYY